MLAEPLHERQDDAQATQVATEPTVSAKVPSLGHSATHVPLWRKGVSLDVQLAQSELSAPVQVPQASLQGWQMLSLSAYLPIVRHVARHELGALKKGYEVAHVVHSVADGPKHVAHDSAHAMHVSLIVVLPPEQVNPASMTQSALHPSKLIWLPSSHASVPTRRPSPHTARQESIAFMLPPVHAYPVSMVQVALQPSPLIVLLSSHSSSVLHGTFLPSPQIGVHVSSPPMPEPPSTSAVDMQWKPSSI